MFECSGAVVAANTALDPPFAEEKELWYRWEFSQNQKLKFAQTGFFIKKLIMLDQEVRNLSSWVKALELMADGKVVPEKLQRTL